MEKQPKVERVGHYLIVSKQANPSTRILAEYNFLNNNTRLYVYDTTDVVIKSFYDDDSDGKVETMFLDGVAYTKKDFKKLISDADTEFFGLKHLLNLDELISRAKESK